MTGNLITANALIKEAEVFHLVDIKEIATVEEDRVSQGLAHALEVELLELRPFGGDDQGIAAIGHVIHVVDVGDVFENTTGLFHGAGIVDAQGGAFLLEPLAKVDGGRHPHVISILLEGQTQDTQLLALENPEGVGNLLHEPFHLQLIDVLNLLKQVKLIAQLVRNLNEGA